MHITQIGMGPAGTAPAQVGTAEGVVSAGVVVMDVVSGRGG